MGMVALSQVMNLERQSKKDITGQYWIIPSHFYKPLRQEVAILENGKHRDGATAFLSFIKGEEAERLIRASGYAVSVG